MTFKTNWHTYYTEALNKYFVEVVEYFKSHPDTQEFIDAKHDTQKIHIYCWFREMPVRITIQDGEMTRLAFLDFNYDNPKECIVDAPMHNMILVQEILGIEGFETYSQGDFDYMFDELSERFNDSKRHLFAPFRRNIKKFMQTHKLKKANPQFADLGFFEQNPEN